MISNELEELVGTQFKIKKVLWFGLSAGLFLYLLAIYFITTGKSPNSNFSIQTEYLLATVGFILLITSIIFRKFTFSDSKLKNIFLRNNNITTTNEIESYNISAQLKNYASRQQVYFIINLGINDTIGIVGIAIGFISKDLSKALPYIIVALLLNIWIYLNSEKFLKNLQSFIQY